MSNIGFKQVGYPLSRLIEDIELGELGLPEIQRPFVWPNAKVRDLFDSMYRGFPVGSLLFWLNGFSDAHRQIGTGEKQSVPRLLIVDGQQRLTSLYAVLKGREVIRKDYSKERIRIAFMPREQRFEVTDAAVRRDPEFIPDISQLWAGPVRRKRFVDDFVAQLRQHREVSNSEEDHLWEAIDRLYDLQTYPFAVLELSATMPEEQVSQVFVRVNSSGTPLNQADFILTLMSVFWDDGRAGASGTDYATPTPASFLRSRRQRGGHGTTPCPPCNQADKGKVILVGAQHAVPLPSGGVGRRRPPTSKWAHGHAPLPPKAALQPGG